MSTAPKTAPVTDSVSKVDDDIAVGEDLGFQRKWWRFEKVLWTLFAAIIVLDLLGAFGRGYLANSEMRTMNGSMDVKYEHIERFSTPSMLRIQFGPSAVHDGKIQLFVSHGMISKLGNRRVIPQPASSTVEQNGILYTFPASATGASAAFALRPSRPGVFQIALQVPGGEKLRSKIFVVP